MLTDRSRTPATVLAEWREAERDLAKVGAGSPEYDVLAARVHELARAYQEAVTGTVDEQVTDAPKPAH